jgi:hypothetical protein
MKINAFVLAVGAGALVGAQALAGPGSQGPGDAGRRQVSPPGGGIAANGFEDNFDSYQSGSTIVGQGGWELWYLGGTDATVSDEHAFSDPNSLRGTAGTDVVQRFDIHEGVWELSVQTYMPSNGGGDGFVIMMNQYQSPGDSWSMQIRFGALDGVVESQWDLSQLPLIYDQWVEFLAVIDLDNDSWDSFYGGQPLATDLIWTSNNFDNPVEAITSIACLDLYSQTATPFFWDSVSLMPSAGGCAPDLDGSGTLDLFDFLAFVNFFNAQDPIADWDADGEFTLFDFLGFVNSFNTGC